MILIALLCIIKNKIGKIVVNNSRTLYLLLFLSFTCTTSLFSFQLREKIDKIQPYCKDVGLGMWTAFKASLSTAGLCFAFVSAETAREIIIKEEAMSKTNSSDFLALSAIFFSLGFYGIYGMRSVIRDFKDPAVYAHHGSDEEKATYQRIRLRPLIYPCIGMGAAAFFKGYLKSERSFPTTFLSWMTGSLVIADYFRKKEILNRSLCHAISTSNSERVIECLQQGAGINARCSCSIRNGELIPIALQGEIYDKPEILELALQHGLHVEKISWQSNPRSLLGLTTNLRAAKILIDNGTDINSPSDTWRKMPALLTNLYFLYKDSKRYDMIFFLCNHSAIKIEAQQPWLHELLTDTENVLRKDNIKKHLYAMQLLLEKGADITYSSSVQMSNSGKILVKNLYSCNKIYGIKSFGRRLHELSK